MKINDIIRRFYGIKCGALEELSTEELLYNQVMGINNTVRQFRRARGIAMTLKSLDQGEARPFPEELFYKLKDFKLGGMPMGFTLMMPEFCNGKCYDRSTELTMAFDDCTQYQADINSLRGGLITKKGDAEHAFVENDGQVYDTSNGFMFAKDAYWKIEKPKVRLTHTKEQCTEFLKSSGYFSQSPENDRFILPVTVPIYEEILGNPRCLSTKVNQAFLQSEFAKFLKEVDYDDIVRECNEDIALMYKDPAALDKKFGRTSS
jgi:hypothetical protein